MSGGDGMTINQFDSLSHRVTSTPAASAAPAVTAELSPTQHGKALLQNAGLTSLEATKNAFLNDPGAIVEVGVSSDGKNVTLTGEHQGWLVVELHPDSCRGRVFKSYAGATAQVWSVLSMQDTGTVTVSSSMTPSVPSFTFHGSGPLGATSLVMSNLEAS